MPSSGERARTKHRRVIVPLVAALSLVIGFAVAQGSGVRLLGAVVLVVGGLFCAFSMWPIEGPRRTLILAVVYVVAFVVSHPLGHLVGTWPAVIAVAAVTGAVAYAVMRPTGSAVSTASSPDSSTR